MHKWKQQMRWLYLAVVVIFALATLIFAFQNRTLVTISFLGFSAGLPLAALVVILYILGALTGGGLFAVLRRSYEGARRHVKAEDGNRTSS